MPWPAAIGVYADLVYARRGDELFSNMAFGEYLAALGEHCDRLVLFGRLATDDATATCVHSLGTEVEFVPLPYYASVADLPAVYRSLPAATAAFAEALPGLDCVWVFGPHPIALRFVKQARKAGVPVAIGVRQDQPKYMRSRLTGVKRLLGVPYFDMLERRWRRIARDLPALTAGEKLARLYGGPPQAVSTAFSLVRADRVATQPAETARGGPIPTDRPLRLLSVGRLDPEKNPLLMPAIVERLVKTAPHRDWRLVVVGDGPLEQQLRDRAAELGVSDHIELAGYVAFGPQLDAKYDDCDILLHVSHTEGLPQVLIEAMAAGLPMVATDVGGVAAAVAGTDTPLVPPDDADAAAAAIARLAEDDAARNASALKGLTRAAEMTVESQQEAVLDHIARCSGRERAA